MRSSNFAILPTFLIFLFSCSEKQQETGKDEKAVTILVQPFKDMAPDRSAAIVKELRKVYPNVQLLEPADLPANAYYKPRNRYRADSLISFLSRNTKKGFVTIGLTSKDISATKGKIKDFGLMGLGFRPGNACIASSFRLSKNTSGEQFFKVAVHELGHTQGLSHCPVKTCFMRDAQGKNPTDEETGFCKKCRPALIKKNWKFNSI
ncbi:matrixin family metalloprotease [uncultured Chryseobacterium sp.]|uniref:matrixin family metalloprotease n=1 Tax=uncultured Chryseobacterium sp. TaxID=259322 RepID=UPI0026001BE7|nr:matrixin family metalloprotease [uncultured Chryseobacterium sp.]